MKINYYACECRFPLNALTVIFLHHDRSAAVALEFLGRKICYVFKFGSCAFDHPSTTDQTGVAPSSLEAGAEHVLRYLVQRQEERHPAALLAADQRQLHLVKGVRWAIDSIQRLVSFV